MAEKENQVSQIPHLSVSQVKDFCDCEARWQYGRQHPELRKASMDLIFGSGIHHAIAEYMNSVKQKQFAPPLNEKQMVDSFKGYFDSELAGDRWMALPGDDPKAYLETAKGMIKHFLENVAPDYQNPDIIEERITIQFKGSGFNFPCRIDLITEDQMLVDWKTAAKAPSNKNPDKKGEPFYVVGPSDRLQLSTYELICRMHYGPKWKSPGSRIVILTKTKTPKHYVIDYTPTEGEIQAALNQISWMINRIKDKNFVARPNFNSFFCSITKCSFYEACHSEAGIRPVTELIEEHFSV